MAGSRPLPAAHIGQQQQGERRLSAVGLPTSVYRFRAPIHGTASFRFRFSQSRSSISAHTPPLSTLKPISAGQKTRPIEGFRSLICLLEGPLLISPNFRSRPDIGSPFTSQHCQDQCVLRRENGTKCRLRVYGRAGRAQGYPRRRRPPLYGGRRAARWITRVRSRENSKLARFASRCQRSVREHFVLLSVILITAGR